MIRIWTTACSAVEVAVTMTVQPIPRGDLAPLAGTGAPPASIWNAAPGVDLGGDTGVVATMDRRPLRV